MNNTIAKRISAAVFCIIITLSSIAVAFGANTGKVYRVDDLEMTVSLPDNMLAITRQSTEDDVYFATFGESYNDNMAYFNEADVYLMANTADKKMKIVLTMTQDENSKQIFNYNLLTDDQLKKIEEGYMESNIYSECSVDKTEQLTYLDFIIDYTSDGKQVYGAYSNTVVNSMIINFTFASANGKLTTDDYNTIQGILKSVKFDKIYDKSSADDSVFKIILIVLLTLVALGAIAFITYTIVKRRNSGQNKHEKILKNLNEEYGLKPDKTTSVNENDYSAIADNTDFDIEIPQIKIHANEEKITKKAENPQPKHNKREIPQNSAKVGGFESSTDYFEQVYDEDFDTVQKRNVRHTDDSFFGDSVDGYRNESAFEDEINNNDEEQSSIVQSVGTGIKSFFVHLGYFCKNLKRAFTSKKKKKHSSKSRSRSSTASRSQANRSGESSRRRRSTSSQRRTNAKKSDDSYSTRKW